MIGEDSLRVVLTDLSGQPFGGICMQVLLAQLTSDRIIRVVGVFMQVQPISKFTHYMARNTSQRGSYRLVSIQLLLEL